uniref:Uncharacterized protein n=1 Tax=Romanomermis culicivorax TaxID=13658 RepID=A0A915IDW7_ROMCU
MIIKPLFMECMQNEIRDALKYRCFTNVTQMCDEAAYVEQQIFRNGLKSSHIPFIFPKPEPIFSLGSHTEQKKILHNLEHQVKELQLQIIPIIEWSLVIVRNKPLKPQKPHRINGPEIPGPLHRELPR